MIELFATICACIIIIFSVGVILFFIFSMIILFFLILIKECYGKNPISS